MLQWPQQVFQLKYHYFQIYYFCILHENRKIDIWEKILWTVSDIQVLNKNYSNIFIQISFNWEDWQLVFFDRDVVAYRNVFQRHWEWAALSFRWWDRLQCRWHQSVRKKQGHLIVKKVPSSYLKMREDHFIHLYYLLSLCEICNIALIVDTPRVESSSSLFGRSSWD